MTRPQTKWRKQLHDFWQRQSEGERRRIIGIAAALLVSLFAWPAWKIAGPMWRQWRVDRALEQAHVHAANDNYRGLLLALQRASQLAPGDPEVWRETAGYLSELGSPDAITAYENLLRLGVRDSSVRVQTAEAALKLNDPARARAALADAGQTDQNHRRLAAAIALRLGEPWTAEQHLSELLQETPDDHDARYNLAILQLPQPEKNEEAWKTLQQLSARPDFRLRAWLALVRDAARRRDAPAAAAVMQGALSSDTSGGSAPAATVTADTLLQNFIARIQKESTSGPTTDVVAVARWLAEIRRAEEALKWLLGLPPAVREDPEVRPMMATLALGQDDFTSAVGLLTNGSLGVLSPEAGTLALAARQQLLMNRRQRAETTWNDAVAVASAAPTSHDLHTLVQVATIWNEAMFIDSALRELLRQQPENDWARSAYARQLMIVGRNAELATHLGAWLQVDPTNTTALLFAVRLAAAGSPSVANTLELSDRVEALQTDEPTARLVRFIWFIQQRRLSDAEAEWEQIPVGARTLPEMRYWQAVWAWERGRFDAAREVASTLTRGAFFPAELERLRRMFGQS